MSVHVWKVTAKRDSFNIAKGMNVEIVIKNAIRKPNQKEVVEAINEKYGARTASNGVSLNLFDIQKM